MYKDRKPAWSYAFLQTTFSGSTWHFAEGWERNFGAGAELLSFEAGEENLVILSGCLVGRHQEVAEGIGVVGGRRRKWAARGC